MTASTISSPRQRMIEAMNARKLGRHSQRGGATSMFNIFLLPDPITRFPVFVCSLPKWKRGTERRGGRPKTLYATVSRASARPSRTPRSVLLMSRPMDPSYGQQTAVRDFWLHAGGALRESQQAYTRAPPWRASPPGLGWFKPMGGGTANNLSIAKLNVFFYVPLEMFNALNVAKCSNALSPNHAGAAPPRAAAPGPRRPGWAKNNRRHAPLISLLLEFQELRPANLCARANSAHVGAPDSPARFQAAASGKFPSGDQTNR